ncbi:hypothetical protein AALO_G00013230 [Alosa alosa]|uniref:NADH dehydrogenase subunit 6 n=1 Tax=Alosa alosa TaxID=278164 RepID=A0AAV6HG97_9TELE|nr:hypothetical protein AALO_G00013230 [Alosa alosa]
MRISGMKAFICVLLCFSFILLFQDYWKSEVQSSSDAARGIHSRSTSQGLGGVRVVSLSVSSLLFGWTLLADLLKFLLISPWMILSSVFYTLLVFHWFFVGLISSVSWIFLQIGLYFAHVILIVTVLGVLAVLWSGIGVNKGLKS